MSKYRGRFGHFQGQPEMFSNNLLARSRRALAYRGQNAGNRCLWRVLENLRNRAVSRPFFCIFDRFIPKNRQLRAPTHSVRSIQLGIERDISSTGFRHPNENWGHYPPVPTCSARRFLSYSPPVFDLSLSVCAGLLYSATRVYLWRCGGRYGSSAQQRRSTQDLSLIHI